MRHSQFRDLVFCSLDDLRDFLAGRRIDRRAALSAPCDGVIEAIRRDSRTRQVHVELRAHDGRLLRLHGRVDHLSCQVGDEVAAGDRLGSGSRDHRALLHAWGPVRLADHLIEELEVESARRGVQVPRSYWALVVRAMLGGGPVSSATALPGLPARAPR